MTTTANATTDTAVAAPAGRLPGTMALGLRRGVVEIKQFFREKDAVVFTFLFPVVLLLIFGSVFRGELEGTGVEVAQYFTAAMIASGIMGSTFVTLGVGIAVDREDGTLKRLRGAPAPAATYFTGKIVMLLVSVLAQVAILLVVGAALFGLALPTEVHRWLTFAWVFVLGVVGCSLLGIAVSSLPRTAKSAPAVIQMPYIVLQFISGVFFVYSELPPLLQQIAALFPLKWLAQGLRSVFLPDTFTALEPAGSWEHGTTALVLGAWLLIGAVLCLKTFRWSARQS
jgi:ABC-2 type transport system permease protein